MRAIFVFGSNLTGRHGAGAALAAVETWGAKYGQARGLQGNTYAIPTLDQFFMKRPLNDIKADIDVFLEFARTNKNSMLFLVSKVGCGLAGIREEDIKPLFHNAPLNCTLPEGW